MLRPSRFQLNAENTSDSEKTFKLKPSALNVASPSLSPSSNNVSSGNTTNKSNNSKTGGLSDGESSNSNSGSLFTNPFMRGLSADDNSPVKVPEKECEGKKEDKKDENLDPLSKLSSAGSSGSTSAALPKSHLFNVKAATLSSGTGFVFGQNISERVTGQNTNIFGSSTKKDGNDEKSDENETESSCNGAGESTSGLFFSNVASSSTEGIELKEVDGKSLLEATRQYEEKVKVQKRKYEEVETVTGEEDERNVIEINCKIFAFEDRNYEERGRGTLRLNDSKVKQHESRVVFRTSGNLRVLINTKVWSNMIVEKPSPKCCRITAIDSEGHIKVFLVQSRPDDITQLFKYLSDRVNKLKAIDAEMDRKSEEISSASKSPAENNDKSDNNSQTPTKYPTQTICIKINDQETGENECKKVSVDETRQHNSHSEEQ